MSFEVRIWCLLAVCLSKNFPTSPKSWGRSQSKPQKVKTSICSMGRRKNIENWFWPTVSVTIGTWFQGFICNRPKKRLYTNRSSFYLSDKREGDNYRVDLRVVTGNELMRIKAAVDYTPSQIKFSGRVKERKKEVRKYEHKINVADWFTTTAFTIGPGLLPAPARKKRVRHRHKTGWNSRNLKNTRLRAGNGPAWNRLKMRPKRSPAENRLK